jgi:alkylation response protein AidB-like acyl-CoA dehydrogenase
MLDREMLDMVISSLRRYGTQRLTSKVLLEIDARDEFPAKVIADLYDPDQIGLHLLFIPEEYGGLGGGAYDIYRVAETLAGIDLGISTAVLATFLGTDPISVGGTEQQKSEWMGRIAAEGLLVAYGATEPQAGSDLSALRTRATPVIEDGVVVGYRLDGQKQWISNGGVAALYTILALAPGGPSWFIVERGAAGFSSGAPEDKHGLRASNTTALFLDNVYVPADRLVGGVEGQGLAQAQAVFGYTRLMVAAFGLGAGWAALERAIRYSQERRQGGSTLAAKQGFTHKLIVPNAVRLEAARAYIEWVAERIDGGEPDLTTEGAVAKVLASEAGNKSAEDAIQAHGGYGYTREYMVEKIKRDVRITTIYEGTSEILEQTIARDRWQLHLKTEGGHYRDWSRRLAALAGRRPASGAVAASLALAALCGVLERCRQDRLTRHQHVLLRLGELIALAESAAVFSERVARRQVSSDAFDVETLEAMARVHARDAAQRVVWDGLRLAVGAGRSDPSLTEALGLPAIVQAQDGLVADMNVVAQKLTAAFPAA